MESKPLIVMSACIEHSACRYDGSVIKSSFTSKLKQHVDFIYICPEVEIGLPIPREAVRIVRKQGDKRLVYSLTGTDVTDKMVAFSECFISSLKDKNVHGFILKSRSPSCGIKDCKMYKDFGKSPSIPEKTAGFFGRAVLTHYPNLAIEDEGRLTNYNIRDHFLTHVFTLFHFDEVLAKGNMRTLVAFHSKNKYLLMAYHQGLQKQMGKIVANHQHRPIEQVIDDYLIHLKRALAKPLRRGTNINMLMHLMGYFKHDISTNEKAYFLGVLEQYKDKRVPFSVPISIIKAWVVRFSEPYLKLQTVFSPYPEGILTVTDSGKGID